MLLGKPFGQFVEESPISVMMRGIVEYAFEAKAPFNLRGYSKSWPTRLTYRNIKNTRADQSNHARNESMQEDPITYQQLAFSQKERPLPDTFTGLPVCA